MDLNVFKWFLGLSRHVVWTKMPKVSDCCGYFYDIEIHHEDDGDVWCEYICKKCGKRCEEAFAGTEYLINRVKEFSQPRCLICNENFIKLKPYEWKGNCKHIPPGITICIG
jgi:hypothetical protein